MADDDRIAARRLGDRLGQLEGRLRHLTETKKTGEARQLSDLMAGMRERRQQHLDASDAAHADFAAAHAARHQPPTVETPPEPLNKQ